MTHAFERTISSKSGSLHADQLDAAPFGVIVVDPKGTILEYNAYERALTGLGERPVIGLQFLSPTLHRARRFGNFKAVLRDSSTPTRPASNRSSFCSGCRAGPNASASYLSGLPANGIARPSA